MLKVALLTRPAQARRDAACSRRSEGQRTEARLAASLAAALLDSIFEHPARCSPVALDLQAIEFSPCPNSFFAAC